mgnify:CR=1 FL=1|jgi:uncharacterized phage protein (TIGR01671 family)
MNREIKFRAWDEKLKLMYATDSVSLCIDGEICYLDTDGEWVADMANRITLMQYTGLKDKNGKEIYEGDIIHCWGGEYYQGYWEYNQKFVVEFGWTQSMWEMLHVENIEVIGNIHDNPELLEVENE